MFIHLITHSERFLCFRVSRHTSEANRQEKSAAVLLLEETAAGGDSSTARSKATSPIRQVHTLKVSVAALRELHLHASVAKSRAWHW